MASVMSPRGSSRDPRSWIEAQTKAYKGWVNAHLSARQMQIESLVNGLSDGVAFVHLLEILEKKPLDGCKSVHKAPRHKFDQLAAIGLCLKVLQSKDRRAANLHFDSEAIQQGTDERIALSLAWRIICCYGIDHDSDGDLAATPEKQLLSWCNRRLPPEFRVHNFTTHFQSGLTLVFLVNQALDRGDRVEEVDYEDMDPDELLEGIFEMAEKQLGIPQLLDVEMVLNEPNKQAIMTYVSLIRAAITSAESERRTSFHEEKEPSRQKQKVTIAPRQSKATSRSVPSSPSLQSRPRQKKGKSRVLEEFDARQSRLKIALAAEQEKHEEDFQDWQIQKAQLIAKIDLLESEKTEMKETHDLAIQEKLGELEERDQTITSLREELALSRSENEELHTRMEQLRSAEMSESANETAVHDLEVEVAQLEKRLVDAEQLTEHKISDLNQHWEHQKLKYIELFDDYKLKLQTSNKAGREYREKTYQLEDTIKHLQDQIAELNVQVRQQADQIAENEREIVALNEEIEVNFEGANVPDLPDDDEILNLEEPENETRSPGLSVEDQQRMHIEASIMSQFGMGTSAPEVPSSHVVHFGSTSQGYEPVHDEELEMMYGPGPTQEAVPTITIEPEVSNPPKIKPKLLNTLSGEMNPYHGSKRAYDRRTEVIKTKFNNEKIVTTWHYLGTRGQVHEVILRHNTRGKRSKRVVIVDGDVKYNEKSNDMEFFVTRDNDNLKIQIAEVEGQNVYRLWINGDSFEDMRREYFVQMSKMP